MTTCFVTDLDGTLLDHHSYSFAPAQPALDALKRAGLPLILATSKTAAEVAPLQRQLDLGDTPAIVENGAGIVGAGFATQDAFAYHRIRQALADLPPEVRGPFEGFGDMGATAVADVTGLAKEQAEAACQRQFTEPGLWHGTDSGEKSFCAQLAQRGIGARRGGRFLTLSEGSTKADAMARVAAGLGARFVVALGDAPNDIEMLETADLGVIIRNDDGPTLRRLAGEDSARIRRTTEPGPVGWNTAVLEILTELNLQ